MKIVIRFAPSSLYGLGSYLPRFSSFAHRHRVEHCRLFLSFYGINRICHRLGRRILPNAIYNDMFKLNGNYSIGIVRWPLHALASNVRHFSRNNLPGWSVYSVFFGVRVLFVGIVVILLFCHFSVLPIADGTFPSSRNSTSNLWEKLTKFDSKLMAPYIQRCAIKIS